ARRTCGSSPRRDRRGPERRDLPRPAGLARAGPALVPPGQRRLVRRAARLRGAARHSTAGLRPRPPPPAPIPVRDGGVAGRPARTVAGDRAATGRVRPAPPQAPFVVTCQDPDNCP